MDKIKNLELKSLVFSPRYDLFMFLCCVGYCFTAMPDFGLEGVFKNIIIIGSAPLIYFCCKDKQYDKKIIWLFFASFLIQIASWLNSIFVIPEHAKNYPDVKLLSSLFLFIFIAFWVKNDKKRQLVLLTTLIISFFFSILYDNYYNNSLQLMLSGHRVDFGLHNAQFTTMIAAVIIMACAYLLSIITRTRTNYFFNIILSISIILSFIVFIVSQSRQVWLATIIVLFLFPIIRKDLLKAKWITIFYSLSALVILGALQVDLVHERVLSETDIVIKILTLQWDNIPMTSFGIRFNSWLEASHWIADNPILGASKEAVRQVLKTAEEFQTTAFLRSFGHLHNYYLETLVSFGIVGLVFLITFYTVITKNIYYHSDSRTWTFFVCFLIFWLIINNFESYNSKHYGFYIQNIILGCFFFMPKPLIAIKETPSDNPDENHN